MNRTKDKAPGKSRILDTVWVHTLRLWLLIAVVSCNQGSKSSHTGEADPSSAKTESQLESFGSYQHDLAFLRKYMEIIQLSDDEGLARVAIAPGLQGRVMTSSARSEGQSFGWLNYDLIASGEIQEHFNPVGGEERIWLGPEGGQFSIYFKPGTSFKYENWYVPKELDTEPFDLIDKSSSQVSFKKQMQLMNYSGTIFDFMVERTVRMLSRAQVANFIEMPLEEGIDLVGFETDNKLTNMGDHSWDEKSGMLSIWILSMLNPSDDTYVIVPFKKGSKSELGNILTDYRFGGGDIPKDRLSISEDKGVIIFKADGKSRGKIGVSPKRALPLAASYDSKNQVLTLAYFSLSDPEKGYVNSLWELQDNPFEGDAVNAYNDGPLEDGGQLGPFYEIESSSPATKLARNESIRHVHGTVHLKGQKEQLEQITLKLFALKLNEISTR